MHLVPLLLGLMSFVAAQDPTTSTTTDDVIYLHGSTGTPNPSGEPSVPTGDYISYSTTMILGSETRTPMPTSNASVSSGTEDSVTKLVGTPSSNSTGNATSISATATSTSTEPVNTRPCNGYPEFCSRSYSNITMVAAHNSPFVRPGNAASNQALEVLSQLDDGIRMLQFQVHMVNGTLWLCHTSCDLLNVGTLEDYFTTVAGWMHDNPYDVVTILIGNFNQVAPTNYIAPFKKSGLKDYVYTPPKVPMALHDWPKLSSMILSGKRAVVFMDYKANQTEVPWLMDEFSQMWETPFSPTDPAFPCTEQRPPELSREDAEDRMYLANHNLNVEVNFGSFHMLIPNTARLVQTNDADGFGSLGRMAKNCTQKWDRPPNFLLVDYYNYGKPNGSVFEVAATMNNVSYDFNCCGEQTSIGVAVGVNGLLLLAIAGIHLLGNLF